MVKHKSQTTKEQRNAQVTHYEGNEVFTGTINRECWHRMDEDNSSIRDSRPGPVYERVGDILVVKCAKCGRKWGELRKEK